MPDTPLEQRAAQRERELSLTLALDRIRDSLDDDDDPVRMFRTVVELLKTHFRADACAIVLLTETSDDIEALAAVGMGEGVALDLCRAAMQQAALGVVENPYFPYTLGNQIVLRGLPLGGLILTRLTTPFSVDEIALLEVAERQIDSAILQARMLWKLIQRNRELAGIYRIDQLRDQLTSTAERITAFSAVLQDAFAADLVSITLNQSRQRGLIDKRGLPAEAFALIEEAAADILMPQEIPTPSGQTGLILLAAPFLFNDERLGTIIIGRGALFTLADHRLLYALTSQIDSALKESSAAETRELRAMRPPPHRQPLFNSSIYQHDGALWIDGVPATAIAAAVGTPTYVYSLRRVADNLRTLQTAFTGVGRSIHIHYSAKANAVLSLLRTLHQAGAGVDAVSAGEIYRALQAGIPADQIVLAGVGKSTADLRFAVEHRIGWVNLENPAEADRLNAIAAAYGVRVRCALRYMPDVTANTHRHIATGHGGAKFGLTANAIRALLNRQAATPHLDYAGLHIHIGSQLHDTNATRKAVQTALHLIAPYPQITTVNIGGGFPVAYREGETLPTPAEFADAIAPLVRDYHLLLEPGRFISADAGLLLTQVEYVKDHGGHRFVIVDAGMTELIRPALYEAQHAVLPISRGIDPAATLADVVGPVCESADVLARGLPLGDAAPGEVLAILTAGAYGMVMASNYNARLRPAEVVVSTAGETWTIARPRETLVDLVRGEQ